MLKFYEWWEAITTGPLDFGFDKRSAQVGYDAGVANTTIDTFNDTNLLSIVKELQFRYLEHEQICVNYRFMNIEEKFNKLKWKNDPDNERAVTIRNDAIEEAYKLVRDILWPKKETSRNF